MILALSACSEKLLRFKVFCNIKEKLHMDDYTKRKIYDAFSILFVPIYALLNIVFNSDYLGTIFFIPCALFVLNQCIKHKLSPAQRLDSILFPAICFGIFFLYSLIYSDVPINPSSLDRAILCYICFHSIISGALASKEEC